ncbi:hypothetical protein Tco_0755397 [Tanacetum coccineum]
MSPGLAHEIDYPNDNEKKADVILPLQSELASPEIKVSLNVDEDIGVDEVSSAIDSVFVIGENNVESMEVRSKFDKFSKNKEIVEEVFVGGGEALGIDEDESNRVILVFKDGGGEFDDSLDEINLGLSEEFVIKVQILCGISGVNKSSFANKDVAMGKDAKIQRRPWDPEIKIFFKQHLEGKMVSKE